MVDNGADGVIEIYDDNNKSNQPVQYQAYSDDAAVLRNYDPKRGQAVLLKYGYDEDSPLYQDYGKLVWKASTGKNVSGKDKAAFTAKFILQTFEVIKLNETSVFYIGHYGDPLYRRCQSVEELQSCVSYWYQVFFGITADIDMATKALIAGILPRDHYPEVPRQYIQIMDNLYWDIQNAKPLNVNQMPKGARVFAKMFDTDMDDANVFKVPPFDEFALVNFWTAYTDLKELPYEKWPAKYRWQCFKDWAMGRPDVEYGMFTVLALPFMRPTIIRGSIFNVGEGHNGKSVLLGLATSMVGSRNTTQVSGNDLGKWDYLVDMQTTWFNCPSETELEFLKEDTGAFKTISAHETFAIKKKHGDASVPVKGSFPMVFNINKVPDFGEDASAILSRMFVNNFDCDFEATGKAVKDYARKTFLADPNTMPTLTGMVMAFAHYYSQPEHLWKESKSMKDGLESISETATPQYRYVNWFKKFFDGYSGINLLKEDYTHFGVQEGEEYNTAIISQKTLLFKQFKRRSVSGETRYILDDGEASHPVKRFTMSDALYIKKYMGTMSWSEYMENGRSIVYDMMLDYLAREDELRSHAEMYREEFDPIAAQKKILQDMFLDIEKEQGKVPYVRKSC
jgi:hypothetical protein